MVGGDPIHVDGLLSNSPKEVTSPDDDSYLATERVYGSNLLGYFMNENRVDTKAPASRQSFS